VKRETNKGRKTKGGKRRRRTRKEKDTKKYGPKRKPNEGKIKQKVDTKERERNIRR
jgi:hypothetical protein